MSSLSNSFQFSRLLFYSSGLPLALVGVGHSFISLRFKAPLTPLTTISSHPLVNFDSSPEEEEGVEEEEARVKGEQRIFEKNLLKDILPLQDIKSGIGDFMTQLVCLSIPLYCCRD